MAPKTGQSTAIPYLYRFLLLNVEPLFALNGAILVLFKPDMYLSTMTRGMLSTIQPSSRFIYTQLAGGWLFLAFAEGVILRLVDDLRVWRLLCLGILLGSDIAYCHSCAQALGGWDVWLRVMDWTKEDWAVSLGTWPFVFVRLAIVMGIGFKRTTPEPAAKS